MIRSAPLSDQPLRWGILGCGRVAHLVAEDLRLLPDHRLQAVASRTPGKAAAFAHHHGVVVALDRYEDLVVRDDIDAVYIATTHERHAPAADLALRHGKPVLCEKPLTLNADQARHLDALARERGVFLMEAMWTRFFPALEALLADCAAGVIGPVRTVQADFGVCHAWPPDHRMVDPARGGGALLDLGVYPIAFAQLVFGQPPEAIHGIMRPTDRGVDAQSSVVLGYPGGGQALIASALDVRLPYQARVFGPGGTIIVEDFFRPVAYTVHTVDGTPRRTGHRFAGRGYQFELAEVAACLRAGRTESLRWPRSASIAVLEVMDTLRRAWGVRYPDE